MPTSSSSATARSQAARRPSPPVDAERLGDLAPDREDRIERGHGLLEDHRETRAAQRPHLALGQGQQVPSLEQHPSSHDPARRRHQPHQAERGHALAAPGFSDEPEDPTRMERERHAVDRPGQSRVILEVHGEILHLEHRHQSRLSGHVEGQDPCRGGRREEDVVDRRVQRDGVVDQRDRRAHTRDRQIELAGESVLIRGESRLQGDRPVAELLDASQDVRVGREPQPLLPAFHDLVETILVDRA